MIFLDWIGEGGDPFWSDVLLLLPLADSGSSFTDYSPLGNAVQVIGTNASSVFEQNTDQTLFGAPTLRVEKDAGSGSREEINLYVSNNAYTISNTDDICVEYAFRQELGSAFSSSPVHAWWQAQFTGDPLIASYSTFPTTSLVFREVNNTANLTVSGVALNTWHHVAQQYVDADARIYIWIDGVQVGSIAMSIASATGWRFFLNNINTVPTGPTSNAYKINFANVRVTKANRYGSASTIPVPSAPWPI